MVFALYPDCATEFCRSSMLSNPGTNSTEAFPVAKLTLELVIPDTVFKAASTWLTQAEQVMPSMRIILFSVPT